MVRAKITYPDVGYTPNNLRTLIKASGLTQQAFAQKNNIPLRTLSGYLAQTDKKAHRTMSHELWCALIKNNP